MPDAPERSVPPRELRDHLLSHGRSSITLQDAASILRLDPGAASDALVRLRRRGQFFSPHRGMYVPIPPEYREWHAVPAMDFIDQLMQVMGREYYVGLLSAAEVHGAAHQRPQVFQVMVDKPVVDRDFGRVRLRFYTKQHLEAVPTVPMNSRTAVVRVSSPAATVLDLVQRPNDCGGLSNVATILGELAEDGKLAAEELVDAATAFPLAALRRVGWLLDFLETDVPTEPLAAALRARAGHPETDPAPAGRPGRDGRQDSEGRAAVLLSAGGPRRGRSDEHWGIVINTVVEPDL